MCAGEICLDILKDAWTPIWTLESTCRAIIFLLANPAADSPLNCDAGNLVRCGDLRGYWSLARSCTIEHAHFLPINRPPKLSVVALVTPTSAAAASAAGGGGTATPTFVTSPTAEGATGTAPSAIGSAHANSFVYLSNPPPSLVTDKPAKTATASVATEPQTKTRG